MKKIASGIKIIFIISVISKIMSFISELVIANALGTTALADVYSMVNGAYIVIYPMISVGIWSCFLPEYKRTYVEYGEKKASAFASRSLTFFGIISIFTCLLFFIFSNEISRFVAPGFSEENIQMLSLLLKFFSPYFVFDTISTIYAAILQANKKFFGSQIREVVCYIPTTIIGPYLFDLLGIKGFVYTLLIGVVLRLVVVLPSSRQIFKFHFTTHIFDSIFKLFLKKIPFALLISLLEQINTLVDKMMASNLITGSIAGLNYGQKLSNAFSGFVTTPIITALYPEMAEYAAKNKYTELKEKLYEIIIILAMIIAPFTIIFCIYSTKIVTLVFQRGSFDSISSAITGGIFASYAFGIYFTGIKNIYNKLLYAIDKIKMSTLFCFINVLLNIVLNFLFVKVLGSSGLAFATSLSSLAIFIIMTIYLSKAIKFNAKILIKIFIIYIINIIIFGTPHYLLKEIISEQIVMILISIIIEFIILFIVYYLFNIGNIKEKLGYIVNKYKLKKLKK